LEKRNAWQGRGKGTGREKGTSLISPVCGEMSLAGGKKDVADIDRLRGEGASRI
jgi:hypothetical protein